MAETMWFHAYMAILTNLSVLKILKKQVPGDCTF